MNTRSAFVAIVGRPNVGKSSLLNKLVGEKVAIVSPKPQTTRTKITGVITKDETQIVFIDTPGIHRPKTTLSEYMVKQVNQSVADVDLAVLVTEANTPITKVEEELLASLTTRGMKAILAINKIDVLEHREEMLPKIEEFSKLFEFDMIIPISARTGDGLDILFDNILKYAEEGPHFFDDDAYTDQPERTIVAEIVREKILRNMDQEIPHGTAVGIESMKERTDREIIDIEATIYCERESHKGMIIGKKGTMLKKIGTEARADIEAFLDIAINLQLWVKVKDDWRNKEGMIKHLGFKDE